MDPPPVASTASDTPAAVVPVLPQLVEDDAPNADFDVAPGELGNLPTAADVEPIGGTGTPRTVSEPVVAMPTPPSGAESQPPSAEAAPQPPSTGHKYPLRDRYRNIVVSEPWNSVGVYYV